LFNATGEQRDMPIFIFWYAVFLVGSAAGATAGSSFGNGFAVVAGLLSGMAISGWIAEQYLRTAGRLRLTEKPLVQPKHSAMLAQGVERIRFASAPLNLQASQTMASEHDTLGAFYLPRGIYEFAMRKRIEKQTSSPVAD
jgi:hypothetical protein